MAQMISASVANSIMNKPAVGRQEITHGVKAKPIVALTESVLLDLNGSVMSAAAAGRNVVDVGFRVPPYALGLSPTDEYKSASGRAASAIKGKLEELGYVIETCGFVSFDPHLLTVRISW